MNLPKVSLQPIQLALALSLRLQTVFPQIRQSATLLVQWLRAQLGLQQQWSTEAASLAAVLAAERALITKCLANDCPRDRRHIEAALDAIHAHQLAHAAHLAPPVVHVENDEASEPPTRGVASTESANGGSLR